jgi:hypothetical protein
MIQDNVIDDRTTHLPNTSTRRQILPPILPQIHGVEFAAFPAELIVRICELVLGRGAGAPNDICPFYADGLHPGRSVFSQAELVAISLAPPAVFQRQHPQVDLGLLGVNQCFRLMCSEMYYTPNDFLFNDARSCLWFLHKIGPLNISNIKRAAFNISSGFLLSREFRNGADKCEERVWCQVFAYLKSVHKLTECVVRFCDWDPTTGRNDLSSDEKYEMELARLNLVAILAGVRGMGLAHVENQNCAFLSEFNLFQLSQLMTSTVEEMPIGQHNLEDPMYNAQFAQRLIAKRNHERVVAQGGASEGMEIDGGVGSLRIG